MVFSTNTQLNLNEINEDIGEALIEALRDEAWRHLDAIHVIRKYPRAMCGVKANKLEEARGLSYLGLCLPEITGCLRWLTSAFRQDACPSLKAVAIKGPLDGEEGRGLIRELEEALHGRVRVLLRRED